MVDSENSTSLPFVSRRELLSGLAATPAVRAAHAAIGRVEPTDPIVSLLREWQRLHAHASGLCRHWQEMETRLVRTVGFPQVFIPLSDGSCEIGAQSHLDIDRAVGASVCSREISAALHAELATHQSRWDVEAERLGFDDAKRQECEAWDEESEAAQSIFRSKAATLAGIEIKLALMMELCSAFASDPEFPLPQLSSTLADVRRLRRTLDALRF